MEKGGMKGGREWCSLTWARRRPCPRMRASRRFQAVVSGVAIVVSVRGCSCPFVGVRVHSWALVLRSCPFVGVRARSWASVPVRGRPCPFVGPRVMFVSVRVHSWPLCHIHVRSWALVWHSWVFVWRSCPLVGVHIRWWAFLLASWVV